MEAFKTFLRFNRNTESEDSKCIQENIELENERFNISYKLDDVGKLLKVLRLVIPEDYLRSDERSLGMYDTAPVGFLANKRYYLDSFPRLFSRYWSLGKLFIIQDANATPVDFTDQIDVFLEKIEGLWNDLPFHSRNQGAMAFETFWLLAPPRNLVDDVHMTFVILTCLLAINVGHFGLPSDVIDKSRRAGNLTLDSYYVLESVFRLSPDQIRLDWVDWCDRDPLGCGPWISTRTVPWNAIWSHTIWRFCFESHFPGLLTNDLILLSQRIFMLGDLCIGDNKQTWIRYQITESSLGLMRNRPTMQHIQLSILGFCFHHFRDFWLLAAAREREATQLNRTVYVNRMDAYADWSKSPLSISRMFSLIDNSYVGAWQGIVDSLLLRVLYKMKADPDQSYLTKTWQFHEIWGYLHNASEVCGKREGFLKLLRHWLSNYQHVRFPMAHAGLLQDRFNILRRDLM